jgi:DNA-binding XRE family transcriptional regulator
MMHIEIFKQGNTNFIKIPEVEFNNLLAELEDLQDIQDIRSAKEYIAAGEETFPSEFVSKLLDAKNSGHKVAIWREYRGIKRNELATAAGVTGSYISMIENGKRKGDITLFRKIAGALSCNVDDLI